MNIQAAYDTWSQTYDTDRNLTRDLDQAVTRKILAGLSSRSIVEIGCGTGKNTLWLSQIADSVHAIDFSQAMLEKAKAKVNSANVTFAVGDITKSWNCSDASADLITCNLVLEHILDLSLIFSEASRVLVQGGYFFVSELHPFRQYQGTKANFQNNQETIEITAFTHHISDFMNAAKRHGFTLEDFQEWWHENDQSKPPRLATFLFKR
ncbi:class I SAM-dependent methyltransferase [Leptolyngbya ohadii]|uniref:class I SAM-dependent methyltransferase n=1 Tax=Leptolyngbya ohadii TaxID=1962290 RepID=UPI000B5A0705|nr:class I SAM-dependent methyltransferase [Leptolyngbya ohadii]